MSTQRRANRSPLWRLPVDREVAEELEFHLEMRVREYLEQGLPEDEARRRALERFGDARAHAAACRRQAKGRNRRWQASQLLDELGQDLKFGVRQLRRRPLLACCLIGLLAVGMGATTAVTVLLDQALVAPPPFREAERLVTLWEQHVPRAKTKNSVSPANFLAWSEEATAFAKMAGFITVTASLTGGDGPPERIKARLATEGYLDLLGVAPRRGRAFLPEDFVEGAEPVVVLGHRLWRQRFGGRADVVDQTLTLNGEDHAIVGVMPADAELAMGAARSPYGDAADLYAPMAISESWREPRGRWMMVLARLAPGADVEQAAADLEVVMARQRERHPSFNAGWASQAVPLLDHLREPMRLPLLALSGAVLLVLLIVCLNASSLMVGRALGRADELAVRRALGAGRRRLLRQLVAEGAVIVTAAGGLAWLLARGILRLARGTFPPELLPAYDGVATAGVWWATLAAAGFCVLLFGLLPGVVVSLRRRQPARAASLGTSRRRHRLRAALVFGQVALALVLLVGAGLMLKTVRGLLEVDPGFRRGGVVSFGVAPRSGLEDAQVFAFYDRLLERLEALPEVSSAGAVTHMPMASIGAGTSYFPADRPEPEPGQRPVADIRVLRGDYLKTLGIPLLAGRAFDARDRAGQPGSILISDALARRHWPGESAVGRQLVVNWGEAGPRTVVGVIGDVHHADLLTAPRGAIYFPQEQERESVMNVVLATGSDPAALAPALRAAVAEIDPTLPIFDLRGVEGVIAGSLAKQRFLAGILGVFALLALVLAAVGIYGVTALAVTQRTREIGLRMALGAAPWEVARQFLVRTAALTGLALLIGLGASVLLGRAVESLFFGVRADDPQTLASTALALALAALVAALIPARRAARLDPTRALRWD